MRRTILYYPNIEIPDGNWLRNSLLYWDEISSIVPREMEASLYLNSKVIAQLRDEGEYRPFYPDELMNSEYYKDFEIEVSNRLKRYLNLKYGKIDYRTVKNDPELSNDYDMIHRDKMTLGIRQILAESRIISRHDKWIFLDKQLGNLYMSTLAKYSALSDINFTAIGTDQIREVDRLYPINYALKKQKYNRKPVVSLSLNILPTPSPDVSYEKILRFKRKYKDNLLELRKVVNQFEEQISNSECEYDLKEKITKFSETIQLEARETMKMLKGYRINFFLSSLKSVININSPTIIAICAGIAGHKLVDISPAITLSGIGVAGAVDIAVNYLAINKSTKEKLSDKGFLYLYYAKNKKIITDFNELL
ncbi:DUF6236 family protein [Tissierella praeacuta]|uniref:DUF6236 family protein n=1 Tax=Tissierella praeacuta TaxID=43131 RepID=UPI003342B69F